MPKSVEPYFRLDDASLASGTSVSADGAHWGYQQGSDQSLRLGIIGETRLSESEELGIKLRTELAGATAADGSLLDFTVHSIAANPAADASSVYDLIMVGEATYQPLPVGESAEVSSSSLTFDTHISEPVVLKDGSTFGIHYGSTGSKELLRLNEGIATSISPQSFGASEESELVSVSPSADRSTVYAVTRSFSDQTSQIWRVGLDGKPVPIVIPDIDSKAMRLLAGGLQSDGIRDLFVAYERDGLLKLYSIASNTTQAKYIADVPKDLNVERDLYSSRWLVHEDVVWFQTTDPRTKGPNLTFFDLRSNKFGDLLPSVFASRLDPYLSGGISGLITPAKGGILVDTKEESERYSISTPNQNTAEYEYRLVNIPLDGGTFIAPVSAGFSDPYSYSSNVELWSLEDGRLLYKSPSYGDTDRLHLFAVGQQAQTLDLPVELKDENSAYFSTPFGVMALSPAAKDGSPLMVHLLRNNSSKIESFVIPETENLSFGSGVQVLDDQAQLMLPLLMILAMSCVLLILIISSKIHSLRRHLLKRAL